MDVLDIFTRISLIIIVLALIGLLAKHAPALLATFFFGYWCGKNLKNE